MRIIELKELGRDDRRKVFTKLVCVYFEPEDRLLDKDKSCMAIEYDQSSQRDSPIVPIEQSSQSNSPTMTVEKSSMRSSSTEKMSEMEVAKDMEVPEVMEVPKSHPLSNGHSKSVSVSNIDSRSHLNMEGRNTLSLLIYVLLQAV